MRVLTPHFIANKTVLLRIDMDVPLKRRGDKMEIAEDFRLQAALPTLYLCLQYAKKVIVMGHIGRPNGEEKDLSVAPIVEWLDNQIPNYDFAPEKLQVLENLRFESGEDECDMRYAQTLADLGEVFVMEAFAAHHPASSTTVLPTLLPSVAGFHFHHEVETLSRIRNNPDRPLIAIIGGAKIEDKLSVVKSLATIADFVLIGGLLPKEIREKTLELPGNVIVAGMESDGQDLSEADIAKFLHTLLGARQVLWSGPMGHFEEGHQKGNKALAEAIIGGGALSIIGGGDTITALEELNMLDQFSFVSTGGGAMLEYLSNGTLPTIEALNGSRN